MQKCGVSPKHSILQSRKIDICSDRGSLAYSVTHSPSSICKSGVSQALNLQFYQKTRKLVQNGHDISVRWVPGHGSVEGNERAGKAAKEVATGERVRTAKWTSLTHIKQQITEAKKLQISIWHEQKTKEREVSRRGFYTPCLKTQFHPLLGKTRKLYASRFYQLKTGHGPTGTFLERIGAVESAEFCCMGCGF